MDPNATLAFIEDMASEDSDDETLLWAVQDLKKWIERGGRAPNWNKFPFATDLFNQYVEKR